MNEVDQGVHFDLAVTSGVDFGDIAAFYRSEWGRSTPLTDFEFYRWQFLEAPAAAGQSHFVVARDARGNLLGVAGMTPKPFYVSGRAECVRGAELTSLLVSEAARGRKVSSGILECCKQHFEVIFASGISRLGLPAYLSQGFRYFSEIPRFIRVVNKIRVQGYFNSEEFYQRYVFTPWAAPYAAKRLDRRSLTGEALPAMQLSGFQRDAAHLAWRYFDHPYFEYHCFKVFNSEAEGCAIVSLRIDVLEDFTVMHVLDVFGEASAYSAALGFIDQHALDHSVDVVDFYSVNSTVNSYFLSAEWFTLSDSFILDFPHLFHPIELRHPATGSFVLWSSDKNPSFFDFSDLYFSKQDANLDRPVLA